VRLIDLNHFGVPRAVGVWQVDDVLVDCGPTSTVTQLLSALDGWRPRAVLLTHVHLDHAGAAGTLARLWPQVEIYVHDRGARHLADPARLNASVNRIYGDLTDALWGEVEPVQAARLHPLVGGERIGAFEALDTPGHATHHLAYLHDGGCAFVGDVAGVRIMPAHVVVPHAPPPDIDLPAWAESLRLIRRRGPATLALPHFGLVDDAAAHLDEIGAQLDAAAQFARDHSADEYQERAERRLAGLDSGTRDAYRHAAPPPHSHAGLMRYWHKTWEAGAT
jgi:glyoxylase-like metal-dependent hydrolase (beta-lactamase superfamily II)